MLNTRHVTFYFGIDPTKPTLHLGHLGIILTAFNLALKGHKLIIVLGTATAKIGDPSGSGNRFKIESQTVKQNGLKIQEQIEKIYGNLAKSNSNLDKSNYPTFVNNEEHFDGNGGQAQFEDILSSFKIKDILDMSIFSERESSPTVSEVIYPCMQAFDWLNLYKKFGCTIQLAGSDQIGNIHMGIELIKKYHKSASAYGITTELLTDQNNKKLSKSSSDQDFNLDSSPYQLYQNLINLPDSTVLDMRAKLLCQNSFSKSPEVSVLKREFIFSILEIIYSSEISLFIKKAIDLLYVQKLRSLAEADAETISLLDMILQKFVFTPKINSNLKNFFYNLIKDPSLSNSNSLFDLINISMSQCFKIPQNFILRPLRI